MSTIENRCQSLMEPPADSTIESLNLKVDGHQVHYLKTGSGPPVTLLRGGTGPVLSYYEFKHAIHDRLTDEAWRDILKQGNEPERPALAGSFYVK